MSANGKSMSAIAKSMSATGNFVNAKGNSMFAIGHIITDGANNRLSIDLNKKSPQNDCGLK